MSFLVTRPPVPEPGICAISTLCSSARRRTTGEERVRRSVSASFDPAAPVALAPRCACHRARFARYGLGLGVRGGELFRGGGVGDVLLWRGVGGGRIALGGDQGDLGADVDRRAFGDEELLDRAGEGRGKLGVHLVRVYFGEGLVYLHLVAFGLQPAGYGTLRHALAELRHRYRFGHDSLLFVMV